MRMSWIIAVVALLGAGPTYAETFQLLSPTQLALWEDTGDDDTTRSVKVVESDGPELKIVSPAGFDLKSPVDFEIEMVPRDGVEVTLTSLKVEYRLGPVWADITGRLSKHGKISGNRLMAKGAELPTGRHTIRVTITDAAKRRTRAVVRFSVR